MASVSIRLRRAAVRKRQSEHSALRPGGWGDMVVFGYMFRVITGLAAVAVPGLVVFIWGALNGWVMTNLMVYFFGTVTALMVLIGEGMRVGVYESRIGLKQKIDIRDDYSGITREFLEQHGHANLSYRFQKRLLDVAIAASALSALWPLLAIVSLLIKFDSPGPVIFRHKRMGFRGTELNLLKFRTMHLANADKSAPEITRVGRFLRANSLDELPTLFNVLSGSMSLVGPRPLSVPEVSAIKAAELAGKGIDVRAEILQYAKPGITGITFDKGAEPTSLFDYILRRSIIRDIRIMLATYRQIIHHKRV